MDDIHKINEYYKLKNKYEKTIRKNKKNIFKEDISEAEKIQKIKKYQMTCVKCKRPGGTIFKNENGLLIAKCNATSKCKLDIEITKGNYKDCRDIYQDCIQEEKKLVQEIIKMKLNVLFKYSTKTIIEKEFKILKETYETNHKKMLYYETYYKNIKDKEENKDKILTNESMIEDAKNELMIEDSDDKIVNLNIRIQNLYTELRDLKYSLYKLENENNNYSLDGNTIFFNKEIFNQYDCLIHREDELI